MFKKYILLITMFSLLFVGGCVASGSNTDSNGITLVNITSPTDDDGNLEVILKDPHYITSDAYFSQIIGVSSSLTTQAIEHSYNISVTVGSGIIVGDQIVMYNGEADRVYIGNVLDVITNTIVLDTPINFNYSVVGATIVRSTKEMNVDGSVNRQTFAISPPIGVKIDITRIMFQMVTTNFPEMDMFGDITNGLVRGVVVRSVNGKTVNYFNVKTNGELVNLMYDVSFYEAAKHGVNGLGGRLTYAGQSKHGSAIRLEQGDTLEAIVQDDLTDILSFRMIGTYHVVE